MDEINWVDEQFRSNRDRLEGIAYRMLGNRAAAEDAVQETWLRVMGSDSSIIENPAGWLTTVTSRVCLDRLKRERREVLGGTALEHEGPSEQSVDHDPAHAAVVADSIGAALMTVLYAMTPEERVAFVLHDVFSVPFDAIAQILDRTPDAARQLASRARKRVQGTRAETEVDVVQQQSLVEAFLRAAKAGDFESLVQMLHPDALLKPDQASIDMGSKPETRGAKDIAAILAGGAHGTCLVRAGGVAALAWAPGGNVRSVFKFTIVDGLITTLDIIADTNHIASLDVEVVS